jgi:hypothetical protein
VTFETDQPEGRIVRATITGRSSTRLHAVAA